MKVLITGAKGQLGQELTQVFADGHEVLSTDSDTLDITSLSQLETYFKENTPDWVINSAAYTDVEGAAKDPQKAMLINGEGTKNLCTAAKQVGAKIVYISTNEVFDGKKEGDYTEEDAPQPLNPYAVSKLAGEKYAREILAGNFIIGRTAWLYGPASQVNFPNKIINRARETGKLEVVDDEISTPTYAPDLAKWVKALVEKNQRGVFHLVNSGSASRFDWAKFIVETLNISVDVNPTKLANYPRLSTPPAKTILSNQKTKDLGIEMRDWQDACAQYLESLS